MPPLLKLAFRNVVRHRGRSSLTIAAIASGVACLILMGGYVADIFGRLRETTIRSQLGHLQITAADAKRTAAGGAAHFLPDPADLAGRIAARQDVDVVLARLHFHGLAGNGASDLPASFQAGEPDKEARIGSGLRLLDGRHLTDRDLHGAMVGEGLAVGLGLRPGDPLTVLLNTPDGAFNSAELVVTGIFRTFSKDYDDRAIRIHLTTAQELLAQPAVDTLVVGLHDTERTAEVADGLLGAFRGAGLEVRTWDQLADFYRQAVDLYDRQFLVLKVIVVVMTVLAVANSISMSLMERAAEIGTMRALGNTGARVARVLIAEAAALGFLGVVVGTAAGIVAALAISAVGIPMPPPPNSNSSFVAAIKVVPATILQAAALGWSASVAASVLPVARMLRLPVVEALQRA